MPGEWYSPTQPFPLDARGKVFAYDWNGFQRDYIIDYTPELRAEGERIVSSTRSARCSRLRSSARSPARLGR